MRIKRIIFGFLAFSLLACNFVTQMIVPPTVTPTSTPTLTSTVTASPSPTPTPLVPAYIPPQCDPVAPLATQSPDLVFQPTPQFEIKEISKQKQLRVLKEIEHIVEQVYVYPDYNGRDWKEIVARYRALVEGGLETEEFYAQMESMIYELGDEHSSFIPPIGVQYSEAELKGKNEFVGIGVYSDVDIEQGKLVVLATFPGSPAEYAGLQPHDSILLVDGRPTTREGGIRTLGPECTAVVLTVQSPGKAPRDVMLIRTRVEGNIAVDARLVPTTDGSKIGYIFIPSFFDVSIPEQIEKALQDFGDLDGLILDVRLNGGGTVAIGNDVLGFFTSGKMGDFVGREESVKLTVKANPVHNSQTVPLVIMVSQETASFGEIFAGLLRDTRGAKITGETSPGNVEILSRYILQDDSWLWIAASTFDSAFSDDNWEETGIVPNIQAYAPWDTFSFDTDPSIAAALELLGHK